MDDLSSHLQGNAFFYGCVCVCVCVYVCVCVCEVLFSFTFHFLERTGLRTLLNSCGFSSSPLGFLGAAPPVPACEGERAATTGPKVKLTLFYYSLCRTPRPCMLHRQVKTTRRGLEVSKSKQSNMQSSCNTYTKIAKVPNVE